MCERGGEETDVEQFFLLYRASRIDTTLFDLCYSKPVKCSIIAACKEGSATPGRWWLVVFLRSGVFLVPLSTNTTCVQSDLS